MMNKKIVWRLKEQPTAENLRELVKDGILSKDEAREILFSSETNEDRDKESLKSEIKFLRELVEKLSNHNNSRIVEIIREVERPIYKKWPWYNPYIVWCNSTSGGYALANTAITTTNSSDTVAIYNTTHNFSDLKTF